MEKWKKIIRCTRLSVQTELRTPMFYAVYGIFIYWLLYNTKDVAIWLVEHKDQLNFFELYISFSSNTITHVIYSVCIMLLCSGAFFFQSGTRFYLIRMDRKSWLQSQILYVLGTVLFFNLVLFVLFFLTAHGSVIFDGSWSKLIYGEMNGGDSQFVMPVMSMYNSEFLVYNPNFIGIMTLITMIIEGVTMGLLLNYMITKRKTVYAVMLILGGRMIDSVVFNEIGKQSFLTSIWRYVSPFSMYRIENSSLGGGTVSVLYSMTVIILILIILLVVFLKNKTVSM